MTIEKCINYIDRYLNKKDSRPRLVNVLNKQDLKRIKDYYCVGDNKFIDVSLYSNNDETLRFEDLLDQLYKLSGNVFLTGFTTYWLIEGYSILQSRLNRILCLTLNCKLIVLGYQCLNKISFDDTRIESLIYTVGDLDVQIFPEIVFSSNQIKNTEKYIEGIDKLSSFIESNDVKKIIVKTSKTKDTFPNSPFIITVQDNAYEYIVNKFPFAHTLERNLGTKENWEYALSLLVENDSWEKVYKKIFGKSIPTYNLFERWNNYTNNQKWLFFISLLLNKTDNKYLNMVLEQTKDYKVLTNNLLKFILNIEFDDKNFLEMYRNRKNILKCLDIPQNEIFDFCNCVNYYEENALYYLTDLNEIEKKKIIEWLSEYSIEFNKDKLLNILKEVYYDLYLYMQPFDFSNNLLNDYFEQYKFQKLTNKIDQDFLGIVEAQSYQRDYNFLLSPRTEILDSIELNEHCIAFFVDALGVEFLGYIQNKCNSLGLALNINVCRAEIPTITEYNKDFERIFEQNNVELRPISDIDEIKHKGQHDYLFEKTKFPIHLISELKKIDEIINAVNCEIVNSRCNKIILISDHGASRLALLYNEKDNIVQSGTKASHGGRVCENNDEFNTLLSFATLSLDEKYYSSANYKRFSGGRITGVEMHGGATLEEVAVPIIEISHMIKDIEIKLISKIVKINHRKSSCLEFYTKTYLEDIKVEINGIIREVNYITNNKFTVEIPKKTRAGKYCAKVFYKGSTVADDLIFEVEKDGFKNNDIL